MNMIKVEPETSSLFKNGKAFGDCIFPFTHFKEVNSLIEFTKVKGSNGVSCIRANFIRMNQLTGNIINAVSQLLSSNE